MSAETTKTSVRLPKGLRARVKLATVNLGATQNALLVRGVEMLLDAEEMPGGYQVVERPAFAECAEYGCEEDATRWALDADGALMASCNDHDEGAGF